MTTLYRCPSVKSNKTISADFECHQEAMYKTGRVWYQNPTLAIEVNRIKRNKLIARKAREIQKLSEVY